MISPAKQQLLETLQEVYPKVQLVHIVKATREDGSILERQFDSHEVWNFDMAVTDFGIQVHHWIAERCCEAFVIKELGRAAAPGEIQVAFRPSCEFGDTCKVIFVDDVSRSEPAHILIETAPNTFQAHYLLSRAVTSAEALVIQKRLAASNVTNSASSATEQLRRFPEGRFVHDTWRDLLDVEQMLARDEIRIN